MPRKLMADMTPMRCLYIDMNSFFASVEQQCDPTLRGRPVAIVAVEAESGCVVAASYEAKAFGIRTGTIVREARSLCPEVIFRPSRHRLYVRVNRRVAAVIDRIAELERVRSIDEFQIGLGGQTSTLSGAIDLSRRIKAAIRKVGSELRCSIGVGPNHLLAKIAGKLEKPDGLQWLAPENMPDRIADLRLDDLPGISRAMRARLWRAHVWDTPALYRLAPRHARLIWRSVEGERFVRALQGENIPLTETRRHGYGNSKVLAPEFRRPDSARLVGRWLIEKASTRLRRDGWCARRVALDLRLLPDLAVRARSRSCAATQDTRLLMEIFEGLWSEIAAGGPLGPIGSVGVHLGDLIRLEDRPGELFLPLQPGLASRPERLAALADKLNRRYGRRIVQVGPNQAHPGFFEKG